MGSPSGYAPPPRRPIGVVILAILVILGGLFLTLIGLLALLGAILLYGDLGFLGLAIAGILLVLALILLASGFGLYNLRPWAWWLAVIVLFLTVVLRVAEYIAVVQGGAVTLGTFLGLGIPLIILIYLFLVRGHFRSPVMKGYAAR